MAVAMIMITGLTSLAMATITITGLTMVEGKAGDKEVEGEEEVGGGINIGDNLDKDM